MCESAWNNTKFSSVFGNCSLDRSCAVSARVGTANAQLVGAMVTVCALEKGWMIDSHQSRCRTTLKDALIRTGVRSSPWF